MILKKIRNKCNNGFYVICKCDTCNKEFKRKYGETIGHSHHFCSRKCKDRWHSIYISGKNNPMYGVKLMGVNSGNWNGGKHVHTDGYVLILNHTHPNCNSQGYVFGHRLIMEKHLGRYLKPKEVIHHINFVKDDNRIENLMLFANNIEHRKHHAMERRVIANGR